MTKNNKRKVPVKLPDVQLDEFKSYKNIKGQLQCEGRLGSHTISRTAGNEKAGRKIIQRLMNKHIDTKK
jgi:hypothetical protein